MKKLKQTGAKDMKPKLHWGRSNFIDALGRDIYSLYLGNIFCGQFTIGVIKELAGKKIPPLPKEKR